MVNIWKELEKVQDTTTSEARAAGEDFLRNNSEFKHVANFAGLTEKGTVFTCVGSSCHAVIGNLVATYRHAIATENGWSRRKDYMVADKTIMEPFLRWVLSPSCIFSKGIVNKDDFEFCRDYGFIVTGDLPFKMLQNTMILTRHFYEVHPRAFIKWNELTEKGFDPFLCYTVCFNTWWSQKTADKDSSLLKRKAIDYNGHRVWSSFTPKQYENYLKGETVIPLGAPYTTTASIYGGVKIFKGEDFKSELGNKTSDCLLHHYGKEFESKIKEARGEKVKEKGYSPPNPFAARTTTSTITDAFEEFRITYEELFNIFVPFVQETIFDKQTN